MNRKLKQERFKAEQLLLSILPKTAADRLKRGTTLVWDEFPSVTLLFSDLVSFTSLAANMKTEELVALLNEMYTRFDRLTEKHGVFKVEIIGDAYVAVAGMLDSTTHHAEGIYVHDK